MAEYDGWAVVFGGASVYRITPCDELTALCISKSEQPRPVHAWEMPRQQPAMIESRDDDEE